MGSVIGWLAVWFVQVGLWLIYVSQINTWELVVGSSAAGLATLGVAVFRRVCLVKFSLSLRQTAEIWRLPGYAISGTWEIFQGIGKQLFSKRGAPTHLSAVPFEVGSGAPACVGRRTLAVLYTTMTPNFIVLGVVREQGLLLYHQIIPGEVLQLTQNLGAMV